MLKKTSPNTYLPTFISLLLMLLATTTSADKVLACKDEKGRQIFTDDARKCGKNVVAEREIEVHNSHSQFGQVESKEYYNYANRHHTPLAGYAITIIVETELLKSDPALAHQTAKRLEKNVLKALDLFPQAHRPLFGNIRYYIFNGKQSSYGGKDGGLWYFRIGNKISKRFDDSIIINSASNYLHISDQWALAGAIHELAHGFHNYQWRRIAKLSTDTYNATKKSGRYQQVKTQGGNTVDTAYALKNRMEYFAELSVFYFATHYYYPFNRQGLAQYDPKGFELMESAWLFTETSAMAQNL